MELFSPVRSGVALPKIGNETVPGARLSLPADEWRRAVVGQPEIPDRADNLGQRFQAKRVDEIAVGAERVGFGDIFIARGRTQNQNDEHSCLLPPSNLFENFQ